MSDVMSSPPTAAPAPAPAAAQDARETARTRAAVSRYVRRWGLVAVLSLGTVLGAAACSSDDDPTNGDAPEENVPLPPDDAGSVDEGDRPGLGGDSPALDDDDS